MKAFNKVWILSFALIMSSASAFADPAPTAKSNGLGESKNCGSATDETVKNVPTAGGAAVTTTVEAGGADATPKTTKPTN